MPADGGSSTDASVEAQPNAATIPALACSANESDGGSPVETFTEDSIPSKWEKDPSSVGGDDDDDDERKLSEEPYAGRAEGENQYLHVRVKNKSAQKPATIVRRDLVGIPTKIRLEYDLAVESLLPFGVIGCDLEFRGPTKEEQAIHVFVASEPSPDASRLIAGWQQLELGQPDNNNFNKPPLQGSTTAKWQHIVMYATVEGNAVTALVAVDGNPPAVLDDIPVPSFHFAEFRIRCGVLFLEPVPNTKVDAMDIGIDNIGWSQCGLP